MKTVLVVEDNNMNQMIFLTLLETAGHNVVQLYDGENIVENVDETEPDLILMDIQLPGDNGDVLMKTLREDSRFDNIPIIAVTAYAMSDDKNKFQDMGFDGYISKPIDHVSFTEVVDQHLNK